MWFCYLKTFAGILLAILALFGLTGCATLNPQPPARPPPVSCTTPSR